MIDPDRPPELVMIMLIMCALALCVLALTMLRSQGL